MVTGIAAALSIMSGNVIAKQDNRSFIVANEDIHEYQIWLR